MMTITKPTSSRSTLLALTTAVVFSSLVGCSSSAKPIAEMSAAKTTVQAAEGMDTQAHAPVAMDRARQKLRRAEMAMEKEDYAEAKRLAEEAQADAELAQAVSAKTGVQQAVKELEDSITVLREEILRARSR